MNTMDDSVKDPPIPTFKSIEEECAYWKNRCSKLKQKLTDTKQEFTKQIRDLKYSNTQMKSDNESMRKKITSFKSNYLQHFSTQLSLAERVQNENEVDELATIELETNKVKTEPEEEEPNKSETNATEVKAAAVTEEESDDSTSTVSYISAQSLEELVEPPCGSNSRKNLNSSIAENEPIQEFRRRSRSKIRSLTQEKVTPSKSETAKRKREKPKGEESPKKAKRARPVTLKRVANSSPNRMEYVIANSPHNIERANPEKRTKEPITSTSTPLRAKNDQSSITKFFKKANTCESCGTFSKDSAYLNFHKNFHSTRQCPGCSINFAGEENFDVTKHIACFLLKSKLSKAELIRMNGMQVTVSMLPHEQIRKEEPKCCTEKLRPKPKSKDRKRQASTQRVNSKKAKANRKSRGQTNKSSLNVDIKDRKRQASTQRVNSKEAKANRKSRGQTNKSSLNVDINAPRDERKKSKSNSKTETQGTMDDSMEIEDIEDISIPLNWNVETAKDKVFWIRSFGSNDPIYIPIRPKKVQKNGKLAKTIQIIDEYAKRASETALNLSINTTARTPQSKAGVNAQDQCSPCAVPRNRSASVFIPVPVALSHEIARTDQIPAIRLSHGPGQPSSVPSNPIATMPNNSGIITCIRKSVLLNTSNPSDMAQNMIVPKQAGLIKARRKSVATEMTRIAMNKNIHQVSSLAPARRFSIGLEKRPNIPINPEQIQVYYQRNIRTAFPNASAISLRSINSDHSYTGPNQPDRMTSNQPQTSQTQYTQIRPNVTYSLQNLTPSQSSPQQPQLIANIARDAFLPSPFPLNTTTPTLVAPAVNNPVSTLSQSQEPKKTQLKVLTVADLNAKVPTGNISTLSQPIPQMDHSNTSDVQVTHPSGFQVSKPRIKLTPLRPQPQETNVIPDTEAISVSLSKIQDEQIELTLNIRGQRIDYESLNDRQKTDVKQCLLRNNIWKEMLGHIKQGKPTQETLNLFKKILPPKERQEFFETFHKR